MQSAKADHSLQMFLRQIANGVPSERDRLLEYTIGEIYNEMSLFVEEVDLKNAALEKIKNKS